MSKADDVRNEVNQHFGREVIKPASHSDFIMPRCPTGSVIFDRFLGGGYKFGGFIERYGPPSAGKTTTSYYGMAECIKLIKAAESGELQPYDNGDPNLTPEFIEKLKGRRVLFVDVEKTFDDFYASLIGVDTDYLDVARPEHGNEAMDIIEAALYSRRYAWITCDTIAALVPKHDAGRRSEQLSVGTLARMMSDGLRKLNNANDICIIDFLNQVREKIGVMWGSPVTTSGGKAMEFYASHRFHITRGSKVVEWSAEFESDQEVGHEIRIKCTKDKVGKIIDGKSNSRRNKSCSLWYKDYVPGIQRWDELKQLAYKWGCIREGGSTEVVLPAIGDHEEYYYKQRGKNWVHQHFAEHEELHDHLEQLYRHEDEIFGAGKSDESVNQQEPESEPAEVGTE